MPNAATIETLEIEIRQRSTGVVSHLNDLARAMASLKQATSKNGLANVANGLERIMNVMSNSRGLGNLETLRDVLNQIRGVATSAATALKGFNDQIKQAPSIRAYKELQQILARMGGIEAFMNGGKKNGSPSISNFPSTNVFSSIAQSDTINYGQGEILGKSVGLSTYVKETQQASKIVEASYQEISDAMETATESGNNFASTMPTAFSNVTREARAASHAIDTVGESTEEAGDEAEVAESRFSKLLKTFKRIVLYRILRGIITGIAKAFKEGIDNMYQWSRLNDGKFAQSMDRLASCSTQLKNALAALAAPLIQLLVPVVELFTKLIVGLANAISWLVALLTGSATWFKVNTDYTEKWDKAAKAAKRTILGFDEINKLNGNDGDGKDYGNMFSSVPMEVSISYEKLKEIFDALMDSLVLLTGGIPALVAELATVPEPLKATQTTAERLKESCSEIYQWFTESISESVAQAWSWATEIGTVLATVKQNVYIFTLETASMFKTWIVNIASNIWEGMKTVVSRIWQGLVNAHDNIVTWNEVTTQAFKDWATATAKNLWAGIKAGAISIYNGLMNAGENIATWVNTTASGIKSWASTTAYNIGQWALGIVNKISDAVTAAWNKFKDFMQATGQALGRNFLIKAAVTASVGLALIGLGVAAPALLPLAALATGGMPQKGDLFIANEKYPELVGSMNNHSVVANNQQIIEGIADGVSRAMLTQEKLLREQNDILRNKGDGTVVISTGSLTNAFDRMNRRNGNTVVPIGG